MLHSRVSGEEAIDILGPDYLSPIGPVKAFKEFFVSGRDVDTKIRLSHADRAPILPGGDFDIDRAERAALAQENSDVLGKVVIWRDGSIRVFRKRDMQVFDIDAAERAVRILGTQ